MKNAERMLVASLKRYAARTGAEVQFLSHDWIAVIARGGSRHLAIGYDLGLNGSAASRIASDKGATFEVLRAAGVPAVEHRVFLHPRFLDFVPTDGNWPELIAAFETFGRDVVIKDNEGTGGVEVFRCQSLTELEQRVLQLFQIARAVAVSPFISIGTETRFVILDGACMLAYAKDRQTVPGDGRQTLRQLIGATAYDNPSAVLDSVPAAGEQVPLQWRHNLGLGARARKLDPSAPEISVLCGIALDAVQALDLRFTSVDVVSTANGPMVLEANAGVMLEVASRPEFGGAELADQIYHRALDIAFHQA